MNNSSKRQYLIERLRDDIINGKYPRGEKFPSEYELANIYNINRITVNKAVSILVEEGYLARASSSRAGTFVKNTQRYPKGIIGCITTLRDSFTSLIVSGAAQIAARNNYVLSLSCPDIDEIGDTLRNMERAQFNGIISVHYGKLNTSLPIVYVDDNSLKVDKTEDVVLCDNFSGGCQIAESIFRAGHRDIVYLSKKHSVCHADLRRDGIIAIMKKYGIRDAESRCFSCSDTSVHHCTLALNKIKARFPAFSAILCNTDYLAMNVIRAGQQHGLDIPGKIAVTGFGNVREIQELFHFTTVEQHPQELGILACERLVQIIDQVFDAGQNHMVDVELIVSHL